MKITKELDGWGMKHYTIEFELGYSFTIIFAIIGMGLMVLFLLFVANLLKQEKE